MLKITISGRNTSELREQIVDLYVNTLSPKSAPSQECVATTPSTEGSGEMSSNSSIPTPSVAEVKTITREAVSAILAKAMKKIGVPGTLQLMAKVGPYKKLSEVPEELYAKLANVVEESL